MTFPTAVIILLSLILGWFVFALWIYAREAFHDWKLGRAFSEHMGSRDSAWRVVRAARDAENAATDALMRRGITELAKHPGWMWHKHDPLKVKL